MAQWPPQRVLDVFNQGFVPPQLVTRAEVEQQAASGTPFEGRDFSGGSLAGLALKDLNLARTVWSKADLRGARFTNCTLDGASFSGGYLGGAAFENCSLRGALFNAASLRGSYFSTCDLSDASLDGADTAGTSLIDITLSPTGAPYLAALRTAIELRGGAAYPASLIAAATGDAFAFTYDRNDRAGWSGRPMTFCPLLLALDTLGFDVTYKPTVRDPGAARKDLTAVLRRGLVAILPLQLAGAGLDGNAVTGPVWVVAHEITQEGDEEQVHVATPFGPMALSTDDLMRRWRGPWPTLSPVGEALSAGRYPLCTVGALKAEVTEQAAVVEALRHGSAIVNEPRTFGEVSGGLRAYDALMQDVGDEQVTIGDVVLWSGGPRLALAASRRLACEFLRESAPKMPASAQAPMLEAAGLYDEISRLLTDEWPMPGPSEFTGDEAGRAAGIAAARRSSVSVVLQEAVERERRAVALLDQAVAEAVRTPGP
jgi:hypothetical protein